MWGKTHVLLFQSQMSCHFITYLTINSTTPNQL